MLSFSLLVFCIVDLHLVSSLPCWAQTRATDMNDTDLLRRAADDASFRRAKLEDLRYFKNVGVGLVWFCAITGAAISLYGFFTDGSWDKGLALGFMAFLCASTSHTCSIRLAALQAIEDNQTRP
jgi:hypothetical protein